MGRYGEALVVADAGLEATTGREREAIQRERDLTLREQSSYLRRIQRAGMGALTGQGTSIESLVGAVAADFFIVGDVRDPNRMRDVLQGVDVIFHFAATVGVGQSMYEISRYMSVNTQGTAELLQAMLDGKPKPLTRRSHSQSQSHSASNMRPSI